MTWSTVPTAVSGAVFTAADYNTYVRDNMRMLEPNLTRDRSGYFVCDGVNSVAERSPSEAYVSVSGDTAQTSFAELDTTEEHGPELTVETGSYALVTISGQVGRNITSPSAICRMSFEVRGQDGVITFTPSDLHSCGKTGGAANTHVIMSNTFWISTLDPGLNTFRMKYRVSSGAARFTYRRLTVLPF